mmetsp:Transcript_127412/g.368882  ORF Transcript_127412/g.368882 Transcript_127412/m.368882 type:complete len:235 (-) Transcript_127412:2158-2862(-)
MDVSPHVVHGLAAFAKTNDSSFAALLCASESASCDSISASMLVISGVFIAQECAPISVRGKSWGVIGMPALVHSSNEMFQATSVAVLFEAMEHTKSLDAPASSAGSAPLAVTVSPASLSCTSRARNAAPSEPLQDSSQAWSTNLRAAQSSRWAAWIFAPAGISTPPKVIIVFPWLIGAKGSVAWTGSRSRTAGWKSGNKELLRKSRGPSNAFRVATLRESNCPPQSGKPHGGIS